MVGVELPVRPRKRHVYHFEGPVSLGAAPLTIDPSGVYLRPEGPAYITGFSPRGGDPDPDTLDLGPDRASFESFVWPALAHRVPAFDRVRHEVVAVEALADHREEQGAGDHVARVRRDGRHVRVGRTEGAADGGRDLGQRTLDHEAFPTARSSSAATVRSSNAIVRSASS